MTIFFKVNPILRSPSGSASHFKSSGGIAISMLRVVNSLVILPNMEGFKSSSRKTKTLEKVDCHVNDDCG